MLARRIAWTFSLVVLVIVVASAFAQREMNRTQAVAPPPASPSAAPAPQADAQMPPERVVRARVGDVVSIDVTTPEPDRATIDALGVSALTSDDVPGNLQFVATAPGTYPVRLDVSGAEAGRVVISSDR